MPTESDYSSVDNAILKDFFSNPRQFLKDVVTSGLVKSTNESIASLPRNQGFEGHFYCRFADDRKVVHGVGRGISKRLAAEDACRNLLSKAHESGDLALMFSHEFDYEPLDNATLEGERDAQADVYNYAARFDLVPIVQFTTSRGRIHGRKRWRGAKLAKVSMQLSEHDIQVSGLGETMDQALIAAAVHFKKAAETFQASRGKDALLVKDGSALNTRNAEDFLRYLKSSRTLGPYEVAYSLQSAEGMRAGLHQSRVMLDGEPLGEPAFALKKKDAQPLAFLTAAVVLKQKHPQPYEDFIIALSQGHGTLLRTISPVKLQIDRDCLLVMQETLHSVRRAGLPDQRDEPIAEPEATRAFAYRSPLPPLSSERRSDLLLDLSKAYEEDPALEELRTKRSALPMSHYAGQVLDLVNGNTYSIIVGATGSGKTTQVPQILLDDAIRRREGGDCNIICTQPRRIAATSVARRVAAERNQRIQESVGYHVRFDAKIPPMGGSILYCTTGILLQQIQRDPDTLLEGITHLVIDEVHERDIQIDFLLVLLKRTVQQRQREGKKVPKVVLMSATIDIDLFANFFRSESSGEKACPSLSVPGRTFPVQEVFLEDIMNSLRASMSERAFHDLRREEHEFLEYETSLKASTSQKSVSGETTIDWKNERSLTPGGGANFSNFKQEAIVPISLVAFTVAQICKSSDAGSILVFLPGLDEILKTEERLYSSPLSVDFRNTEKYRIFKLHSSISNTQADTDVFAPVPDGCRKIILATNIAETSITIPDVQHVVDTGKLRQKRYDQARRISELACTWESKSNSKQRAGRAGRVQNGNYYALFTRQRYESLRATGLPEMLRTDLQEICLDVKAQSFNIPVREFLEEALESPPTNAIDQSVKDLQALEALTDQEEITPLGRLLASLPVHPSLGKMIVLGIIFRCLDPMLILGAASGERPMFLTPIGDRKKATSARLSFVEGTGSDQIALVNAFRYLRRMREEQGMYAMNDYAFNNFLHAVTFKTISASAQQIEDILTDAKLIPVTRPHQRYRYQFGSPSLNENSDNPNLIKALLLAGTHPNLACSFGGRTVQMFRTPGESHVMIHPSSINYHKASSNEEARFTPGTLLTYNALSKASDGDAMFLRDTTESTSLMAALFGGRLRTSTSPHVLEMDRWLPFYVSGANMTKSEALKVLKTLIEFRKAMDRVCHLIFLSTRKDPQQVK